MAAKLYENENHFDKTKLKKKKKQKNPVTIYLVE